jgi:threonine dehydrogenase-like Zn-dependent dehydrogenase
MRAVVWESKNNVKVTQVPDPEILNPRDAIIKVSLTSICGSDLQLYSGFISTMKPGDVLGHEFMGEVVEVGRDVKNLAKGDWVVVPCAIACGRCYFCRQELWSLCDNSNPNASMGEEAHGHSGGGRFGYSHMYGGYPGGQAEYVRVPFADVGPVKIYEDLSDEQVLFLSDIFPAGYMAAEQCNIRPGDTIAVWGCGPVGLFAIKSALMLGAERIIAIDRVPQRLLRARECRAETVNFEEVNVLETLKDMTGGRGPDACIDAVGLEAHAKKPNAQPLAEAIKACRKGGTVSIPGMHGAFFDQFPIGAAFAKGLTLKLGQSHIHKYMRPLLDRICRGDIDPAFVISHRFSLEDAPRAYRMFRDKEDDCTKIVMKP